MANLSRREFAALVAAGLPLSANVHAGRLRAAAGVVTGVSTSSFRDLPRVPGRDNIDEIIAALRTVGASHIELSMSNVEPAPPPTAPFIGGSTAYPQRVVLTPEQVAATNAGARAALRAWRGQTGREYFERVRAKFDAAGIIVHACALAYNDSFTDDEIDATLRQVKTLGVGTVSSPLTMATAARLAPFARRHQIGIAIHNQPDGNAAGLIATPQLGQALAIAPSFSVKLDIGHLTASNADPVAELREFQGRVTSVLVRDRLRNGGASQPFGEGDTPIAAVLGVLKTTNGAIPAFVEYDYVGLRAPVVEVADCLAYVSRIANF